MSKEITQEQIKMMVPDMQFTGQCVLNIEEVKKLWDEDFFISQWKNTFRIGSYNGFRVTISSKQANQIISDLNLICEQSELFSSGRSWVGNPSATPPTTK